MPTACRKELVTARWKEVVTGRRKDSLPHRAKIIVLPTRQRPCRGEVVAYRRAVCAACDAFAEFGEGQVGGFALGDFKVTHYEDEGTTGEEIATQAALRELVGTSLAFAGVR